jgi:hypothetical protein
VNFQKSLAAGVVNILRLTSLIRRLIKFIEIKMSDQAEVQLRDSDFVCKYNKLQLSTETSVFLNSALRKVPPHIYYPRERLISLSYRPIYPENLNYTI